MGMRISEESIARLQVLLKNSTGKDYQTEEAQKIGRAVLRFVGIKLFQTYEKEVKNEH